MPPTNTSRRTRALIILLLGGLLPVLSIAQVSAAPKARAAITTTTTAKPTTTVAPTSTTAAPTTTTTVAPTTTTTVAPTTTTTAPAPAPTTLLGMRYQNPTDPYTIASVNLWQGKRTAVSTVFRKTNFPIADLVTKLKEVWNGGSVPVYSIDIIDSNAFIAGGGLDPRLDAIGAALKTFLAGPDAVYGNADDRRIFLRPAWEANGNWYAWSPCTATGGPASDYRAMFRRIHDRFTLAGMDSRDSSWIFSVNQADWPTNTCAMEDLYPGDAYVDWLGLDAYTRSAYDSPEVAFTPMVDRLRALAPGKPVSVNEAGVSSRVKVGKSAYITSYFKWVADHDIRMVAWFNNDNTNGDWTVYGGTLGDESILGALTSTLAWSSYRVAVSDPRYVGSSLTNPRLLTDAQFTGR